MKYIFWGLNRGEKSMYILQSKWKKKTFVFYIINWDLVYSWDIRVSKYVGKTVLLSLISYLISFLLFAFTTLITKFKILNKFQFLYNLFIIITSYFFCTTRRNFFFLVYRHVFCKNCSTQSVGISLRGASH